MRITTYQTFNIDVIERVFVTTVSITLKKKYTHKKK